MSQNFNDFCFIVYTVLGINIQNRLKKFTFSGINPCGTRKEWGLEEDNDN